MDVFSTVLAILVAGVALFVGYKIGIKDGFRGGVHTGRLIERGHADEERRFLTARLVHAQAELHAQEGLHRLTSGDSAATAQAEVSWQTEPPTEALHGFANSPEALYGESQER